MKVTQKPGYKCVDQGFSMMSPGELCRLVDMWHNKPNGPGIVCNRLGGLPYTWVLDVVASLVKSGVPAEEIAKYAQYVEG